MSKVSIITPSYNRAYIIHETAQSIFNQTYENWEWVIVDDGSTDNSWDVLQSFAEKDKRVKIFKRDRDPKGACVCRNIGVERCSGDYVMFLDTDDVLAPYCLEQRVKAMENEPECDFVIFPMLLFKEELNDLNLLWNIDKAEDDLLRVLTGDAVCQGTGPLWKKSSFQQVGMWNEDLKLWQDVELHIRSFLYPVRYKKRLDLLPDVYLRVSDDSLSRVGYHAPQKLMSRIQVFEYALEEIAGKGKLDLYKQGLRVMAADVLISVINGKLYPEAAQLMGLTEKLGVFDAKELKRFRHYLLAYNMRLYKIPPLFRLIKTKLNDIIQAPSVTIGTVKWQHG
ncbi:MAG TPA: glycosyltransferase family A protein [Flavipsychrobacter sp.]